MNQEVENTKTKRFNREWIVPIVCGILIFLMFAGLYIQFNYTDAKHRVCFNFSFIYFGCVPEVYQKSAYFEPNTTIYLNEVYNIDGGRPATFFVKENGQKKETISFSSEGEYKIELYVDFKGKVSKTDSIIKIGDATPPVIIQNEIPKVKVGEVVDFSSYVTITDDRDSNPILSKESIVAETVGEFTTYLVAMDKNGNQSSIDFKYEVIA